MSNENEIELSEELVSNKIYFIRNQKVMLDIVCQCFME
jgi:hypothetical protein